MSSSVGVLDFFIVEANECIERLDALLASAGQGVPDLDAFARYARTLRGSATMSRQQGIAGVAAALEGVARALRARALPWEPGVAAAVTGAVDDLRILLRGVRGWGPGEDQRAAARAAELARFAPAPAGHPTPAVPAGGTAFLAEQTAQLSRALDHLATTPDAPDALPAVVERVRALRGLAGLRDLAPLPEVLEVVERTAKRLELGPRATPGAKERALCTAAAAVLRRAARDIAASGAPAPGMPEMIAFDAAVAASVDESGRGDHIVPIAELFHDDDGPHVVAAAAHPPTTVNERFRLEVVSLAEHLRVVVAEARARAGDGGAERAARAVGNALRALGSAADSFGEQLVARFAAEWSASAAALDARALDTLDAAAALLADPSTRAETLTRTLEQSAPPRPAATREERPAPAAPAAPAPVPQRGRVRTPTGRDLHEFLQHGIAGFDDLERRPLSAPTPVPSEEVVPIETLLYRGRAALERAAELRATLLRDEGAPPREIVQELFDLIDLALVD